MKTRSKASGVRPLLEATEAQLYVGDIEASQAFYTSKLGFSIAFAYGEPPFYAQVHRDNARLNLRLVSGPVFAGDVRDREGLLSATITVSTYANIGKIFREFQTLNVPFAQTLKDEPWGAKTFIVVDPDGNLVMFAGPAE